jgi:hypothetical protein
MDFVDILIYASMVKDVASAEHTPNALATTTPRRLTAINVGAARY